MECLGSAHAQKLNDALASQEEMGIDSTLTAVSWSYYENSDEMQHHQEEVVIIKASGGVCVSK